LATSGDFLPATTGDFLMATDSFITRAADHFAPHGILRIERVITDNHFSYRRSTDVAIAITQLGAAHKFIKPHCPLLTG
jgi:hypothetical protein